MSIFRVQVELAPLDESRWESVLAVVDTGSTLTKIPRALAERLGLSTLGQRRFRLSDERVVERDVAAAVIRLEGRKGVVVVALAGNEEEPILGVTALEGLGFAADPVGEVLIASDYHEYAESEAARVAAQ